MYSFLVHANGQEKFDLYKKWKYNIFALAPISNKDIHVSGIHNFEAHLF